MQAPHSREKRRHERVLVDRAVQLVAPSGTRVTARLINLSVSGAAVRYSAPADVGTRLQLDFQLPFHDTHHKIRIAGTVRYAHVKRTDYVLGIEFEQVDETSRAAIIHYLCYKQKIS